MLYIPIIFLLLLTQSYASQPIFTDSYENAIKIVQSEHNRDLLFIFGAEWCQHCNALKNEINSGSLDHLLDNKVVCYIDIEKNVDLKKKYKVSSLPDSRIIKPNKTIFKLTGYSKKEYEKWLNEK